MNKIFAILILIVLFIGFLSNGVGENVSREHSNFKDYYFAQEVNLDGNWYQNVQVYDMVALPPEDIEKYCITVNGLWNGFMGEENLSSPFALGRYLESLYSGETYLSDMQFVESQHNKGLIVPATILTTQGHRSFQGAELEEFACRSIDGELCYWDVDASSYWMNSNNPDFIDWCIEHGKKAIDAGADMIVLDEIQGNGFIPMYQWAFQYLDTPVPGFSNHTIDGFRANLTEMFSPLELQQLFDINDISTYDFRDRIGETMNFTYDERITVDPLIDHYITFLEVSNFQAKKRLVNELRTYASDVGKDVVIGANSFALGTNRPAGYWPKGLQFSEMLDVFVFENEYTALEDTLTPEFPRNKWLAWEKLARASTGAPAVILLSAGAFASISPMEKPLCFEKYYDNYLSILCAEAYANRGSFVNWYYRPWEKSENWNGCAETYDFVLNHRELYDSESLIDAPVAILYLYGEGMRNKTDTYLGLSQALAESNMPFEVIFDGDGYFINESLNLDKIESYDFLIIPSVIEITEMQEQIIKDYVENGGIALVFNPEEIGFEPIEGEVPYGNGSFVFMLEDIGYEYYHTYNNGLRQDIETVVKFYIESSVTVENANRKIIAFPYYQSSKERVVIHLVNYDHSKLFDGINQKNDISIRIKKPDFDIGEIYVISPDFEGKTVLQTAIDDEYVEFIVPYLEIYDVIVVEKQSDDKLSVKIGNPEGGFLYVLNKKITSISSKNSIIIGKIGINAVVEDTEMKLSKLEFYIDDILMKIDRAFPYTWIWAESSFGIHTVKIISYDVNGTCCGIDTNIVWKLL
jgi:hypothetical protein